VFGNGKTRLNIEFDDVKPYGAVYACNAVYREYAPDYLIAVDRKMLEEINATDYPKNHSVWTYIGQKKAWYKHFNYIEPNHGWSSGPTALNLASTQGANEIYIFGFDYQGLDGKVNNVFADTPNYKGSDQAAVYYGNWLKQTDFIIKTNPSIKYYRVTIPNFFDTNWRYDNYYQMTYEKFKEIKEEWQKIR
jgi:hypothetical protein